MKRYAKQVYHIDDSKTHPGYKKYIITVVEPDGQENDYPAYGRDATDALRRLDLIIKEQNNNNIFLLVIMPSLIWFILGILPISWILFNSNTFNLNDLQTIGSIIGFIFLGIFSTALFISKVEKFIEIGKKG